MQMWLVVGLIELWWKIKKHDLIFSKCRHTSMTNTETPKRVSTELTSTLANNPASVDLTNPQVSFWQVWVLETNRTDQALMGSLFTNITGNNQRPHPAAVRA